MERISCFPFSPPKEGRNVTSMSAIAEILVKEEGETRFSKLTKFACTQKSPPIYIGN